MFTRSRVFCLGIAIGFLLSAVTAAEAGGFDVGGLMGGIMQGAIQAQQQQQLIERQQQLQQLEYEQSLRRQPYPPVSSAVPNAPQTPEPARPAEHSPRTYTIDGHALGDTLVPQNLPSDYKCYPSEQFTGFQWCRSSVTVQQVLTATAVVLSPTDAVVYDSKFYQNVHFEPGAVGDQIAHLSGQFHEPARVVRMPGATNDANALISTWGAITLTPLDADTLTSLSSGKAVSAGILVDFLADPRLSAKRGLPVYRLTGGAGYYWAARFDRNGRGSLRYGILDASAMTAAPSPVVTATVPPPAAVPQRPTASAMAQVTPTPVQTNAAASSSAPRMAALEPQGGTVASDTSAVPAVVADQGRRVALVIGNSAYLAAPALDNPRLDAEAVADSLRSAGFSVVTLVKDATLQQMKKALRDFELEADTADWAMVYYAGHGLEIGGHNYLIPVDARLDSDRDADDEAVTLDYVLSKLEKARKLQLVILDACREDPFRTTMKRAAASRSMGRGLARIEPSATNELVVFAAKDGEQALDGTSSGHSPFAQALIARLAMPKIEINKMFRLVTADVMTATQNTQRPFVYGSTLGDEDFYFRTQ